MEETNGNPQAAPILYPGMVDKGILQERTTFTQELKSFRFALTGVQILDGEQVTIFGDAALCMKHFNRLVPKIFMSNTKAVTLSNIQQERADYFIIDSINNMEAWLVKNCLTCSECGMGGDYDTLNEVIDTVEAFFFGNFNRAVGGFEAEKLSMSHQSQELTHRYEDERPKGIMGIGGWFRKGGQR